MTSMLFKLRITVIAAAIITLCFVISSDAYEIESLSSDYGTIVYDYGWDYILFTLTTDVAYSQIDWYIDFHDDEGYQLQETVFNDGKKTISHFNPDSLPGEITGKKYTIKADVLFIDADFNSFNDSDTCDIYVCKPIIETRTKRELMDNKTKYYPDVSGNVELSAYCRIGNDLIMNYIIHANYSGDDEKATYTVWAECKNTIFGLSGSIFGDSGWKKISTKDRFMFAADSVSNSLAGGERNREYTCEAYVRLVVQGNSGKRDNYHEPTFPFQIKLTPQ